MAQDALGALISIIASAVSIFGLNIQKHAHSKVNNTAHKNYLQMPVWWLGMSGVVVGAIGDFVALGIGGQALVTAVGGATTLLVNILFAKYWHNEQLYSLDLVGVMLIITGAVVVAAVAHPSKDYTLQQLLSFSQATPFVTYMFVLCAIILSLLARVANSYLYKVRKAWAQRNLKEVFDRLDRLEKVERQLGCSAMEVLISARNNFMIWRSALYT